MDDLLKDCTNIEPLFEGGQKSVYKATHPQYGSVVLKRGKIEYKTGVDRIIREVELLKSIDSKYFPKNFEFHLEKDKSFLIVEEYIESNKIYELLHYYNTEEKLISLLKELINGLKILWDKNIVHRDLKPDNILITKKYEPKIIDLGIARFMDLDSLTKTIALQGPGTSSYSAPEQLQNLKSSIDMRTDFFALGILILEVHLNLHPFHPDMVGKGSSIPENIINEQYVKPTTKIGTSPEFNYLINRLLKVHPYQRFRNYIQLEQYILKYWG